MTPPEIRRHDWVGPVLDAGPVSLAIIEAIRDSNPDLEVIDRGSYLRVLAPVECSVSAASIEAHIGGPFALPTDLERVMLSFKGRFSVTESGARWFHEKAPEHP